MGVQADVRAALSTFRFNESELRRLLTGAGGPVVRDLARRAIRVEASAKQHATGRPGPNVRTGRLRGSITWRVSVDERGPYADVGSSVYYACVFGAGTHVVTDCGWTTIGQLRAGERVMTQTGEFREVLAKTAFPAIEKPDLVDLVVPWRKGRDRRLTLTLDHKVLCHRDGRNQWVMAGDLRDGDLHFHDRRLSPPLDEPLPGSRHVVCNPGTDSFIDPATFRRVPVRVERHWRYGPRRPRACLYDVAVEGVHSFVANGVVVSNSFVELGTSRMPSYPFLRPALEAARVP